jgi:hypothetical protein
VFGADWRVVALLVVQALPGLNDCVYVHCLPTEKDRLSLLGGPVRDSLRARSPVPTYLEPGRVDAAGFLLYTPVNARAQEPQLRRDGRIRKVFTQALTSCDSRDTLLTVTETRRT